eukprot:5651837-Pyramimonas_sp.AAC.1
MGTFLLHIPQGTTPPYAALLLLNQEAFTDEPLTSSTSAATFVCSARGSSESRASLAVGRDGTITVKVLRNSDWLHILRTVLLRCSIYGALCGLATS